MIDQLLLIQDVLARAVPLLADSHQVAVHRVNQVVVEAGEVDNLKLIVLVFCIGLLIQSLHDFVEFCLTLILTNFCGCFDAADFEFFRLLLLLVLELRRRVVKFLFLLLFKLLLASHLSTTEIALGHDDTLFVLSSFFTHCLLYLI